MKRSDRFWKPLLEPGSSPWVFVTAAVLLGLIGNAAYDLLKDMLGTPIAALGVGTLSLAVLAAIYWGYRTILHRSFRMDDVPPHRGLIVLVSPGHLQGSAAQAALQYHLEGIPGRPGRLTHCWLIAGQRSASEEQEPVGSSWRNARELQAWCEERKVVADILEVAPDDCADVRKQCREAWHRARDLARLPSNEVIADLTGGTKLMTVGMVLAAIEQDCKLQYLQARRLLPGGTADRDAGSDPKLISLRFFLRERWEDAPGD